MGLGHSLVLVSHSIMALFFLLLILSPGKGQIFHCPTKITPIEFFLAISSMSIMTTTPSSWVPSVCCDTKITYSSSGYPDAFYLKVAEANTDITEQCPGSCVYVKYVFPLHYCSFHLFVYRIGDPSFSYYCLSYSNNATSSCLLIDPTCCK